MNAYFKELEQDMGQSPSFDGEPAKLIHLTNAYGMTASFMDIGATWLSCILPIKEQGREILLRSTNMNEHIKQSAYFGSIVGRFANRIAKGRFELEGKIYQLPINNGENSLHGGTMGFDKKRWKIEKQTENQVTFSLHSYDGEQGYPGNLDVKVSYELTNNNAMIISYFAIADKTSPVNLTNHAYFNLAGEESRFKSLDHHLQLNALHYLPTNEELIPTGELKSVLNTSFDFTQSKQIGEEFLSEQDQKIAGGYDHAFIFEPHATDGIEIAAKLIAPQKDVVMKVKTTKPAIQFYSGNFLENTLGRTKAYDLYDGLALETQYFPNGPNNAKWGNNCGLLKAQAPYQHKTIYQFEF